MALVLWGYGLGENFLDKRALEMHVSAYGLVPW